MLIPDYAPHRADGAIRELHSGHLQDTWSVNRGDQDNSSLSRMTPAFRAG
jgi:hypothetical protein